MAKMFTKEQKMNVCENGFTFDEKSTRGNLPVDSNDRCHFIKHRLNSLLLRNLLFQLRAKHSKATKLSARKCHKT